jgi:hypothetical protein
VSPTYAKLRVSYLDSGLDNQPAVGGNYKIEFFNWAKPEILKDGNFKGRPLFAN